MPDTSWWRWKPVMDEIAVEDGAAIGDLRQAKSPCKLDPGPGT
jgi:hypothetical protein